MKNWKTTIVGLLTGGTISIDALVEKGLQGGWQQAILGLAVALLGAFAKDYNVSGQSVTASK